MPVNRNALVRYKTIDNCLRNRFRKWTLEDLINACSEALYEYEGIDKGVSRRTIQMDLQMMRSEKLGYNAPIVITEKKYYTYEDPAYSITNIPISRQDMGMLTEAVEILKQFRGFSHFRELGGMINKLEDKIYSGHTEGFPVIDFEKNEHLKGLDHLDGIYRAIVRKQALLVTYQSFKAQEAASFVFFPYLLKEYRNRWFVLGLRKNVSKLLNLALDRIQSIQLLTEESYIENTLFDSKTYFNDVIGVTRGSTQRPGNITFLIHKAHAPYVVTKPFHASQELIEETEDGSIFKIRVVMNFELERELLGFGEDLKVLSPPWLKRRIQMRLQKAGKHYDNDPDIKHSEINTTNETQN
jgi:predicted DNA-binding transcriptional regulator YafY